MANPTPRVILHALKPAHPASRERQLRISRQKRLLKDSEKMPDDPLTRALMPAIENMRTLVGHVAVLLDGPTAREAGIMEWLDHLQAALDRAGDPVVSGTLSSREQITIDDEEVADLDDVLSRTPEIEGPDWQEQVEFQLLSRLAGYWIEQVRARGYSLFHLLIGADDLIDAARSLARLGEVRYPLEVT